MSELLEKHFCRHPAPAFAITADLVILAGDGGARGLEAVCINDGRGNLFGWHESRPEGLTVIKWAMAHWQRYGGSRDLFTTRLLSEERHEHPRGYEGHNQG